MYIKPIIFSISLLVFSCDSKKNNSTESTPDIILFKPLDTIVNDEVVNEFYSGLYVRRSA